MNRFTSQCLCTSEYYQLYYRKQQSTGTWPNKVFGREWVTCYMLHPREVLDIFGVCDIKVRLDFSSLLRQSSLGFHLDLRTSLQQSSLEFYTEHLVECRVKQKIAFLNLTHWSQTYHRPYRQVTNLSWTRLIIETMMRQPYIYVTY